MAILLLEMVIRYVNFLQAHHLDSRHQHLASPVVSLLDNRQDNPRVSHLVNLQDSHLVNPLDSHPGNLLGNRVMNRARSHRESLQQSHRVLRVVPHLCNLAHSHQASLAQDLRKYVRLGDTLRIASQVIG